MHVWTLDGCQTGLVLPVPPRRQTPIGRKRKRSSPCIGSAASPTLTTSGELVHRFEVAIGATGKRPDPRGPTFPPRHSLAVLPWARGALPLPKEWAEQAALELVHVRLVAAVLGVAAGPWWTRAPRVNTSRPPPARHPSISGRPPNGHPGGCSESRTVWPREDHQRGRSPHLSNSGRGTGSASPNGATSSYLHRTARAIRRLWLAPRHPTSYRRVPSTPAPPGNRTCRRFGKPSGCPHGRRW
jgi:hypothetical protein